MKFVARRLAALNLACRRQPLLRLVPCLHDTLARHQSRINKEFEQLQISEKMDADHEKILEPFRLAVKVHSLN